MLPGFGEGDVCVMGREVGRVWQRMLEPVAGDLVIVRYGETKKERREMGIYHGMIWLLRGISTLI